MPPYTGVIVKASIAIVGVIFLFLLLSFLRSIYTDWLWFDSLGFGSVFAKILLTRILLFFLGATTFAMLLSISLYFANRYSTGPINVPLPQEMVNFLRQAVFWGAASVLAVLSIIFGAVLSARWEIFLRFTNSVSFGETEPVFGKDLSFYVFTMPVLNFVQGWALGVAILIMLSTLALYVVNANLQGARTVLTPALKVHASVLAAAIMFVIAWGHWLDRWEILLSGQGAVFGAAYADINARSPALLILTIIAVASGGLMLVNAYIGGLRLLVGAFLLWVVMAVTLGAIWPALMQQFTVTPNEFAREAPYIARNIEFTRKGFALDRIQESFYQAEPSLDAQLLQDNMLTVNNIRLWDYRPLTDVYRQIQLIRPYYDFMGVDVDRYFVDGEYRQVLLAAREVAPEKLSDDTQTWVNTKLIYTHGIGIAMSPVTEFTPEGRPEFFAKDIPPNGTIPISAASSPDDETDIVVTNPRIYFGENTKDYVIVNTKSDELDFQTEGGEVVRTRYTGDGGVRLSSFLRRIAYAWEFADLNILISGEITGDSLIQYHRRIQERVSTIAPFLLLDRDPYIVAAEGQFFWIQDAYTVSDHFPYSDPIDGSFNYMRNSVKVVIDAFDGTTRFYVWDESDPIVRAYASIFPDLFLPQDAMPASLQQHVRYPVDFFTVQARKYVRYHMENAQDFYNNEDLWAFPQEKFGSDTSNLQVVEPYYVIMRLPGQEEEEFVLLLPYTPNGRENLIGWLAARSDGESYGSLVAFNFPKDRQIDGTAQVEARIDNDPEISAWFTLRCTEGSSCIRGNLLVIPIGDSLLYAEPVYIQAQGVSFPELKQVILASGEKVVMAGTLDQAVGLLTGLQTGPGAPPGVIPPPGGVALPPEELQREIESLTEAIGDIKDNLARLEEALQRLKDLTGGE